ncbi:MAG: mechanosensitive ion channel domain-containing protein [Bacteroidota bacterium]
MEALSPGIFSFPVMIFIITAAIIFSFFRLFKYLIQFMRLSSRQGELVARFLPVTELAVWVIFFIWSIQYLFNRGYLITLVPVILFTVIILYIAWYILKDVVAGVIFKTTTSLRTDDHISVVGISGKVTRAGQSSLELEDYSGRIVSIPYSRLVGQILLKHYPSQSLLSHNFLFSISRKDLQEDIFNIIKNLHTTILALPWASQKKEPKITIQQETSDSILFNITIFSLDESYFLKTEKYLEKEFHGQVITGDESNERVWG